MITEAGQFDALFQPITVGTMRLPSRIMMPPHGVRIGNLFGTEDEARRNIHYWTSRVRDGAAWVDAVTGMVGNTVVRPGFEPTGVGAVVDGDFRLPVFVDRCRQLADAIHGAGGCITGQLNMLGGMPHGPSHRLSAYVYNAVPHELEVEEIRWLVEEYAFSTQQWQLSGFDGVEIHFNHDDIFEWFMSPATNRRTDAYGGDRLRRLRFAFEVIDAIRQRVGRNFTLGLRVNLRQFTQEGYDLAEGIEICRALEATGQVDYFSVVMGAPWSMPSYIQPHYFRPAEWADQAGALKQAISLPVVYTGGVRSLAAANDIVARGLADLVGMARANIAEPELVSKSRAGRLDEIRPCVGCNECVHRMIFDGLPFSCAVNPGVEVGEPALVPAAQPRRVLVVGGGAAGMELAAVLAERGHEVALWERGQALGGQMRLAAKAPANGAYLDYIAFQDGRLARAGVELALGKEATAEAVLAFEPDAVAIATGATARRPDIAGVDQPFVFSDRDVLAGAMPPGDRIVVIAQEDHYQPLAVATYLADRGKQVHLVYQTPAVAPGVGRYSLGTFLGKLSQAGARFTVMERVVEIAPGRLATRNVYADTPGEITGFDAVVLACGGLPETALYTALKGKVADLHILGDAYAPRKVIYATRMAYKLGQAI